MHPIFQEVGFVNDWPVIYEMQLLKNEMNSLSFIVGNKKALQSKHISRHCKRSKKGKETNTSIVLWIEELLPVKVSCRMILYKVEAQHLAYSDPFPPDCNVDWQYFVRAGTLHTHRTTLHRRGEGNSGFTS